MRILVADDDSISGDIALRLLKRLGHEAVLVADGLEALALLLDPGGRAFDLAFLDLSMPRLDGLEAARRIRRAGLKLPLYLLSGTEDKLDLAEAGFSGFIGKPYELADLAAAIELSIELSIEQGPSPEG